MINEVSFLVACSATLIFTPVARRLAVRWNLLDVPNERSSHSVPTPRVGGYAILGGIAAAVAAVGGLPEELVMIIVGAAAIAVAGAVDDRLDLREWQKLVVQILAAGLVTVAGDLTIVRVSIPAAGVWNLGVLTIPFTALWLIGYTNAFNFMDGINGIASSSAVVTGVTMSLLFTSTGHPVIAAFSLAVAGACAGFLPWNLTGSIFMGDVGSATLGFLLAGLAVLFSVSGGSFIVAILPMLPFIADSSITLGRRIARGEKFYSAHRSHFYQRLNRLGWSHARVTGVWFILAVAGAGVAIACPPSDIALQWSALGILLTLHAMIFLAIAVTEGRREASGAKQK